MKKKKIIVLFVISIFSFQVFAQTSNEVSVNYGIYESALLRSRSETLIGAASYEVEHLNELGFKYLREISDKYSLETGIIFSRANVKMTPAFTGDNIVVTTNEELKNISIPFYVNYTLLKYLFINAGPMLDIQITDNSFDSQTGIGYGVGFGGKYGAKQFSIFVNPNFKRHALIPFNKENYHQKLTEFGVQFGVGYRF